MQTSKIDQTYIDDSLRIMRNVRFATRYGFKISDPTWKSMKKNVYRMCIITQERITDEIKKTLMIF